jgi:hypothetical protein
MVSRVTTIQCSSMSFSAHSAGSARSTRRGKLLSSAMVSSSQARRTAWSAVVLPELFGPKSAVTGPKGRVKTPKPSEAL